MKTKAIHILFFVLCTIFFSTKSVFGVVHILFCDGENAYIVEVECGTCGVAVSPAGKCAGGSWVVTWEIAVQTNGPNSGNLNWANETIIETLSNFENKRVNVDIPQSIIDAGLNGTLPKVYVKYNQLTPELIKYIASRPFVPIERFRIHPVPVKGKTIRFSFYSDIASVGQVEVIDFDIQETFETTLQCKFGMNEVSVKVPDHFSGTCLFHMLVGNKEESEIILID